MSTPLQHQQQLPPPPSADAAVASTSAATTTTVQKKKQKAPPPNLVIPPPRPKLSKEERRALQEQQRAAKSSGPTTGGKVASSNNTGVSLSSTTQSDTSVQPSTTAQQLGTENKVSSMDTTSDVRVVVKPEVALISHLLPYKDPSIMFDTGAVLRPVVSSSSTTEFTTSLHPDIIQLGYQYATGTIRGGNSRCRVMLECYSTVLQDFAQQRRALVINDKITVAVVTDWRSTIENTILKPAFIYWTEYCRSHSVSMGNAFTFLKTAVSTFDRDVSLDQIIATLLETIAAYVRERIDYAKAAIAETACSKLLFRRVENSSLSKMEVLLTYGHSEAVMAVLALAIKSRKKHLRIIIVDSPPLLEGRILLQKLQQEAFNVSNTKENTGNDIYSSVDFTYIHLRAVTYVLPSVSKVLLGAAALQTDGSVTGRVGTAMIALAAHTKNIPVLICSETHKISNLGIPLESLTQNELLGGVVHDMNHIKDANAEATPKRIDLLYDLTPASYVSGIVTELGIVPPSSVAVLLRELNQPSGNMRY